MLIFLAYIQPICIPFNEPEKSRSFEKYKPFAAGWGRTQEGGKSANVLQEIQLPIISNEQCRNRYSAINKVISDKQFDNAVLCAGFDQGGQGECFACHLRFSKFSFSPL
jgi:Trypsin